MVLFACEDHKEASVLNCETVSSSLKKLLVVALRSRKENCAAFCFQLGTKFLLSGVFIFIGKLWAVQCVNWNSRERMWVFFHIEHGYGFVAGCPAEGVTDSRTGANLVARGASVILLNLTQVPALFKRTLKLSNFNIKFIVPHRLNDCTHLFEEQRIL